MSISDLMPWNWTKKKEVAKRGSDPFSSLQQQLNSVFDNFLTGNAWELPKIFDDGGGSFVPKVNVKESENEIQVTAELPGLTQDQIDVKLTDDALVIKGEKRVEHEQKDEKNVRTYFESSYGSFQRTVPLACEVDSDKIDAQFKNGVLTIKLPKTQQARSQVKKVSVRGG